MPQTFWDMFGGCCGLRKRRYSNADDQESQPFLSSPHHPPPGSIHSSIIPSPYIPAKDSALDTSNGYGGTNEQLSARERKSEERRVKVEEIGRDVGGRMMPLHSPFPRLSTSPKNRQRSIDHSHTHTHSNLNSTTINDDEPETVNENADASGSTVPSTRSASPGSVGGRRQLSTGGLGLVEGAPGQEKGGESGSRKEVVEEVKTGGATGPDQPTTTANIEEKPVRSQPSAGNTTTNESTTSSPLSTAPPSISSPRPQTLRLPTALDRPGGAVSHDSNDNEVRKVSLGISGAFGPAGGANKTKTGGEGSPSDGKDGSGSQIGHVRGGGRGGRGRGRGRGKGKGKK